jgi:hypothetical protein
MIIIPPNASVKLKPCRTSARVVIFQPSQILIGSLYKKFIIANVMVRKMAIPMDRKPT